MSRTGCFSLLGLLACGDPLAGAAYKGEELYAIAGTVSDESLVELPADQLRVTILWARPDSGTAPYEPSIEVDTTFPARYRLGLFSPPDAASLNDAPWGGGVALGVPVLYQDTDGDGSFNDARDGDPVVGGTDQVLLIYATETVPVPDGETGLEPLAPGFHALEFSGEPCQPDLEHPIAIDPDAVELIIAAGLEYEPPIGCEGGHPP